MNEKENLTEKEKLNPYFRSYVSRGMKAINEDPDILLVNKQYCISFMNSQVSRGLSQARLSYYAQRIPAFARFAKKDFRDMTRDDINQFWAFMNAQSDGEGWGQDAYVTTLKLLFRTIFDLDSRDPAPPAVRYLKKRKQVVKIRPGICSLRKRLPGS